MNRSGSEVRVSGLILNVSFAPAECDIIGDLGVISCDRKSLQNREDKDVSDERFARPAADSIERHVLWLETRRSRAAQHHRDHRR